MSKVDTYITQTLLPTDSVFTATLKANASAGLDEIDVSPPQGKFLYLLAQLSGAKHILEVGTLGGYSALWFAKAAKPLGGSVSSLEIDAVSADVARKNIANAGFEDVVTVHVGPAADTLASFSARPEEEKPVYDFIFIDANKDQNLTYFKYALEFSKIGSVIVVDNVARRGRLADEQSEDDAIVGTRALFDWIKKEEEEGRGRVESSAVQTVGGKGWDGFLIARVCK